MGIERTTSREKLHVNYCIFTFTFDIKLIIRFNARKENH